MRGAEFFLSAVPDPVDLLGFRLRPLSAGHIILLTRIESGFITGGEITWEDLAASVFICTQTFEDAVRAFYDPRLPRLMKAWHDRLSGADTWACRLGLQLPKVVDLKANAEAFAAYLKEATEIPEYNCGDGASSMGDVPMVQCVKAFLLANTSMTETEILNRSWRLSLWDFLTIQAIKGNLKLYEKGAIGEAQDIGRKLAEMLKSKGVKCAS